MRKIQPVASIVRSITQIADGNFQTARIITVGQEGSYVGLTKAQDTVNLQSQESLVVGDEVKFRSQSLTVVSKIQSAQVTAFDV